MRRRFIQTNICILGFLAGLGLLQAQQCTPPPAGMVAWYTGDGTANDFVGSNNGTLQNGATFTAGKVGTAFLLNGTNQFVGLPSNVISYPGLGATSTQPITVDAWFQTTAGGVILGQQGLVTPPTPPASALPAIYVGTDGFLYAELFWRGAIAPIRSAAPVNNGIFHHVAVTYDGTNEVLYLDGVLANFTTPFIQTGYASSYQYQIGTGFTAGWPAGNGGYFYFNGIIDEVEIFNRALSQAEVQAIVNAGSAGKCKSAVTPGVCTPAPAGMTAWYTGDGTAADFLGGNNGTLQNGATYATGKVAQAFSLSGIVSGGVGPYVSLPANVIPYGQPVSVDAWFQTTSGGVILGQQGTAVPPNPPPTGFMPAIYVGTDGYLYAQLFWNSSVTPFRSSAPVNNGVFHHVAVTFDGQNQALYLDGALVRLAPLTQIVGYAATYQYQIGTGYTLAWPAGNSGYFYFNGMIDEVEIFNRALSQAEVQAIVNAGSAGKCKNPAVTPGVCTPPPSGMTAWYAGDGSASDLVGSNNATAQNGVTFAAGKVGQAFSLNGNNQYVTVPGSVVPYPAGGATGTQPFSVDAWFQTTAGGVILGQQGAVGPPAVPAGAVPAIYVGTDGFLYAQLFWNGSVTPVKSSATVNNGVFHHVAVTYNGTTEVVYLDGAQIGSVPFTQVGYASSYQYQLGTGFTSLGWPAGNSGNGYFYFQGLLDEVEFFGRALTQAEVQAIVNAGSAGKCKPGAAGACTSPPSGMTAWYTAEGNARDFLGDNNATLRNGVSFSAGKVGQAFSLNGRNQYVDVPSFMPYPTSGRTGTQPISVDAWFQTTASGVILGQQSVVDPPATPTGAVPAIYVGTDGMLYVELFWKGSIAPISSAPVKVNNGVFHHVAVTYDGATEIVYLDGVNIGSAPFTQTGYASTYQYQIGTGFLSLGWPAGNTGYFYFQGLIDEVQFFNRALTQAEVQGIVNAGSAGNCRNHPPVALCKSVRVLACSPVSASINNGSHDPDAGDTITLSQAPAAPYPVGTTTVTLTVTDNHGASSQCSGTVTVSSSAAVSETTARATPRVLWPPDQRMVPVTVSVSSAGCSSITCKIVSVSADERTDPGDWVITGNLTLNLRADRNGNGNGRVYTITVRCTDGSGNAFDKRVRVTVPHEQRPGRPRPGNGQGNGNGNGNNDGGDGHGNGDDDGHGHGPGDGNHHGDDRTPQ